MNERAVELYREACEFAYTICKQEGRTGGPSDHIWNTLFTSRFAELIVGECIRLCDQVDVVGADECIDNIREHFGVRE